MNNNLLSAARERGDRRIRFAAPLGVLVIILGATLTALVLLQKGTLTVWALLVLGGLTGVATSAFLLKAVSERVKYDRLLAERDEKLVERGAELEQANARLAERNSEQSSDITEKLTELEKSRTAMISLLEDLTESRDRVEEARAFSDAVLASLSDGVVVMDTKGLITRTNRSLQDLTSLPETDMVGHMPRDVFSLVDAQGQRVADAERPMTKILAMGADAKPLHDATLHLRRTDGALIPLDIEISPVRRHDQLIAFVAIVRDVTEVRRIDRSKSEFVSLASHQLRTPLTAIGWYSELLLGEAGGKLSEQEREYLSEIYQANRRMIGLVDALLNVSRIEMGSIAVEPELINVPVFLHEEIGVFAPLIASKNLTVQTEFAADIPPYQADPKLMTIIVQNLLSNAIKYTDHNGTITIAVAPGDGGIILTVTDTGIGIPKEVQSKVYNKLFRADNAVLMAPEGSGLGMYLIKSILDQIGGTVSFASELGKGTKFSVVLPRGGMKAHAGARTVSDSLVPTDVVPAPR